VVVVRERENALTRVHLKKQGMLPLTFADPKDYEGIQASDKISILGAAPLSLSLSVSYRTVKPSRGAGYMGRGIMSCPRSLSHTLSSLSLSACFVV
jgi:hypothetical protein